MPQERCFKASRLSVILYTANGALFVVIGLSKLLLGPQHWPMALFWCLLSSVWFVQAARIARIPVVVLEPEGVRLMPIPVWEVRHLPFTTISGIGKHWFSTALLLDNGSKVPLPLSLLAKEQRQEVLDGILERITPPAATRLAPKL